MKFIKVSHINFPDKLPVKQTGHLPTVTKSKKKVTAPTMTKTTYQPFFFLVS